MSRQQSEPRRRRSWAGDVIKAQVSRQQSEPRRRRSWAGDVINAQVSRQQSEPRRRSWAGDVIDARAGSDRPCQASCSAIATGSKRQAAHTASTQSSALPDDAREKQHLHVLVLYVSKRKRKANQTKW